MPSERSTRKPASEATTDRQATMNLLLPHVHPASLSFEWLLYFGTCRKALLVLLRSRIVLLYRASANTLLKRAERIRTRTRQRNDKNKLYALQAILQQAAKAPRPSQIASLPAASSPNSTVRPDFRAVRSYATIHSIKNERHCIVA